VKSIYKNLTLTLVGASILSVSVPTVFADGNVVVEPRIINPYYLVDNVSVLIEESLNKREIMERSLINGERLPSPEDSDILLSVSEEQLAQRRYVLSDDDNKKLKSLISSSHEFDFKLSIKSPYRAADCTEAYRGIANSVPYANAITCAPSTQSLEQRVLTTMHNAGGYYFTDSNPETMPDFSTAQVAAYTGHSQGKYYKWHMSYGDYVVVDRVWFNDKHSRAETDLYFFIMPGGTKKVFECPHNSISGCSVYTKNSDFHHFPYNAQRVRNYSQEIAYTNYYPTNRLYEQRRYSDVTLKMTTAAPDAGSSHTLTALNFLEQNQRRYYDMRLGFVPIDVGGITTFIKAPVKHYNSDWINESGFPKAGAIEGKTTNAASDVHYTLSCNGQAVIIGNMSPVYGTGTQAATKTITSFDLRSIDCGTEPKFVINFQNVYTDTPLYADEFIRVSMEGQAYKSQESLVTDYDQKTLAPQLQNSSSQLELFEDALFSTLLVSDRKLGVQTNLWRMMQEFNGWSGGVDSAQALVTAHVIDPIEPLPSEWNAFINWVNESPTNREPDATVDVMPSPNVLVGLMQAYHTMESMSYDEAAAYSILTYGCSYKEAWREFSDQLTLGERFVTVASTVKIAGDDSPVPSDWYSTVRGEINKIDADEPNIYRKFKGLSYPGLINPYLSENSYLCPDDTAPVDPGGPGEGA